MDYFAEIPMPDFEERVRNLVIYATEKGTNKTIDEIEDAAIAVAKTTPNYSLMGYIAGGQREDELRLDECLGEGSN
jgi:hypothetical protein